MKGELGARIKAARKKAGLTQDGLAKKLGVKRPTVTQWELGKTTPHADKLEQLARALGLPRLELFEVSPDTNIRTGPNVARYVPEISWVQAGSWTEVVEVQVNIQEVAHWPCPVACSEQTFCLRVEGDSMSPMYPPGTLIFVDPEAAPVSGKRVIAMCDGYEKATFKQYFEEGDRRYLKAMNPSWPEPYIPITEDCWIIGTVVFSGRED